MKNVRIAVLASGSGSNAERLFNYFQNHDAIEISLVITNNAHAGVIARCERLNLECFVLPQGKLDKELVASLLDKFGITHIVLAGYLKLIPGWLILKYLNRMINIHPSLLPLFGGKGMYGSHVHEAVVRHQVTSTGITIHLVNEEYDKGKILLQKSISLSYPLSAEEVANKIHQLEYQYFPPLVEAWVKGI